MIVLNIYYLISLKNVSLINLRSDPHPSFIELQDKAYTTLYQLYSEFYDYICFF